MVLRGGKPFPAFERAAKVGHVCVAQCVGDFLNRQVPGFEVSDEQKAVPQVGEDETPAPKGLDPNGGVKGKRKSKKDKLREAAAKAGGQ